MKVAFPKIAPQSYVLNKADSKNNALRYNFSGYSSCPVNFEQPPVIQKENGTGLVAPSSELLKAYFVNFEGRKKYYPYNSISSLRPNYAQLNCDYRDVETFSTLYAQKVNSQLMAISKTDVENLIARLQKRTGADRKLVEKVLYHLTLYSNYDSIEKIQDIVDRYRIREFGLPYQNPNLDLIDTSFNGNLSYIAKSKAQIKKPTDASKAAVFIDSNFVNFLESIEKSIDPRAQKTLLLLKREVANRKVILLNIPSWDIKCLDGKYRSANLFQGTGYLEDIAKDTIARIKKGEKLEDILYGDFDVKIKKILDNKTAVKRIRIEDAKINADAIYKNLKTKTITKDDVKGFIDEYFDGRNTRDEYKEDFLRYLDKNTFVFSPDSFSKSLVNLHARLSSALKNDGNDIKDAIYVLPESNKSFTYVLNTYLRLNNIDSSRATSRLSLSEWSRDDRVDNPKIILDDISASGETEETKTYALSQACSKADIYYGTLVTTNKAVRNNRGINDITMHKFIDAASSKKVNSLLGAVLESGFSSISSVCAFPYMIPDTNSDFASILFAKLLYNSNPRANRGLEHSFLCHKRFYVTLNATPKGFM